MIRFLLGFSVGVAVCIGAAIVETWLEEGALRDEGALA